VEALILSGLVGVGVTVVAGLLLQLWPSRFRWDKPISVQRGQPSGRLLYRVRLGRPPKRKDGLDKPWLYATTRLRRRTKRPGGPIDVSIRARIVIGVGTNAEAVAAIPVLKEWRPVVSRAALATLVPHECELDPLRHFPADIRTKRKDGTLSLHDLLAVERTQLRLYAFAYRPYLGTRIVARETYGLADLRPGSYKSGYFVGAPDGQTPSRDDILDE